MPMTEIYPSISSFEKNAVKSVKAALKKISCGSVYLEDKTWSSQLDDKVEPLDTTGQSGIVRRIQKNFRPIF